MKNLCKCLILGGAVGGMMIGAATAYMTAVIVKQNTSVTDMCCTKAKKAFKNLGNKISL